MHTEYPDSTKSEALALARLGHPAPDISDKLGVSRRTIYYWLAGLDEADHELGRRMTQRRIGRKAAAILEATLDDIADGTTDVSPQQAAVIYGITTDKEHRQQQLDQQQQQADADVEAKTKVAALADALYRQMIGDGADVVDSTVVSGDRVIHPPALPQP